MSINEYPCKNCDEVFYSMEGFNMHLENCKGKVSK